MRRNLDLSALRSFLTVADLGGVTRAAGALNLTQSAVSMQIKRLEETLQIGLFERRNRSLILTPAGEQMLSFARRMLHLNDEAIGKLTGDSFAGEITIGVPHDIVYPVIPRVLRRFARDFPRVQVRLISSYTTELQRDFRRGVCDIILTTERETGIGGEALASRPLRWIGAPGGEAWRQRPLQLAFENSCIFRSDVQRALDDAGIEWEMAVISENTRTIEATVSADLAVHTMLAGMVPSHLEEIEPNAELPELGVEIINLYCSKTAEPQLIQPMIDILRQNFADL